MWVYLPFWPVWSFSTQNNNFCAFACITILLHINKDNMLMLKPLKMYCLAGNCGNWLLKLVKYFKLEDRLCMSNNEIKCKEQYSKRQKIIIWCKFTCTSPVNCLTQYSRPFIVWHNSSEIPITRHGQWWHGSENILYAWTTRYYLLYQQTLLSRRETSFPHHLTLRVAYIFKKNTSTTSSSLVHRYNSYPSVQWSGVLVVDRD